MDNNCPVACFYCPSISYCTTLSGVSGPCPIRVSICCRSGDVLNVISRFDLIRYIRGSTVIVSTITGDCLNTAISSDRQCILIYRPLCIQGNVLRVCPGPTLTDPACPVGSRSVRFLVSSLECISGSGESIFFRYISRSIGCRICSHGSGSTVGIISHSILICSPLRIQCNGCPIR